MKKCAVLANVIMLVTILGLGGIAPASAQTPPPVVCNTTPQGTPVTPALLTSGLPCQVEAIAPFTLDHLQNAFDFYSWLTFVALSAPADGSPIGKDAPSVWESWKNIFDIMVKPGQTPPPWSASPTIPAICQNLPHIARTPVLSMGLLTAFGQPFDTGPLIDLAGKYVHYEILVNQPMFDYIIANKLYSKAGQAAFNQSVVFPGGSDQPAAVGAIMVKAAWKVLEPGDNPGDFHSETALIYTPASADPPIAESCTAKPVALVGLHIGHKTVTDPQWIWTTYEHTANAPSQADIDAKKLLAHYNFYDPTCPPGKCAVNVQPPRPWNPNQEPVPGGFHSQIVRVIPIPAESVTMNGQFHAILKNTVWANYDLISTQWPTNATSKTDPTGAPAPRFLANLTMETYIQGVVPLASSNCIECHKDATTKTNTRPSDFTYILERAQ
jgi:hypothetical protein